MCLCESVCVIMQVCVEREHVLVVEIKSASRSKKREEKRRREREFLSVCEGTLSSSPQNPWRGLPCQSISWSWLQPQWENAHTDTHTQAWLSSCHCESSAILLLHTEKLSHTHTHLAHWDDSEEMASSSWGVPSLLYRNCSTLEASPRPVLSLCACMHISVGVWCAVCLCAG